MFIISEVNLRRVNILKSISRGSLMVIGIVIMLLTIVAIMYKPAYEVTIGQKVIGYIDNKEEFINKVDNFINQKDISVAYVDMQDKPEYTFLLVDREKMIDNEKVYKKVVDYADVYSRVYSVFADDMEIAILPIHEDVESILADIVEDIGNTNVSFMVKESHLINPKLSTKDDLIKVVNNQYKEAVKRTALSTVKRTANGVSYIDTGIEFTSPLSGYVTSRYGYRSGGEFHTGLDIAKPIGTPIYAAATGEVIFSGTKGNFGKFVAIQHADNVITYYAHCNELLVEEGEFVVVGTQIATIGMTGRTTGPHLHFEVRIDGKTVNPEIYINNVTK